MTFLSIFSALLLFASTTSSEPLWGVDTMDFYRATKEQQTNWRTEVIESPISFVRERLATNPVEWKERHQLWTTQDVAVIPIFHQGQFLEDDLGKVFHQTPEGTEAFFALESLNEPEFPFVHSLPDVVASYQKARYLGILAQTDSLPMLSPSFVHPAASKWQEVYGLNGAHAYSDALNLHYYGWISSFGDFIDSHRYGPYADT